ncbi:MAG: AMP-binding protein, partial [Oscillochloris sp.]|nr:AMP-binding protein [Oscillochloris sp.]
TRLILRDLAQVYNAINRGDRPALPQLAFQYVDFASWQRSWFEQENLEPVRDYWREHLANAPPLDLPLDRPRPAVWSTRGAIETFELSAELTQRLRELSRQEGATLFMVLLASLYALLYRYTRQTDLIIGTPVAGRTQRDLEEIVGPFINTLALRLQLNGAMSVGQLIGAVRSVTVQAYSYQDFPFEQVVELVRPSRDLSRATLFQVMLALQNVPVALGTFDKLSVRPINLDTAVAQFDLSIDLRIEGEQLSGVWEYNADIFEATTIRHMIAHLEILLEAAAADPRTRIDDLPIMSAAERRYLIEDLNSTAEPLPAEPIFTSLFATEVARNTNRIALREGEKEWSYEHLHRLSNGLAHALCQVGVGPEDIVAIISPRGITFTMALLAAMKAGSAYLPIDPTYPPQRIALLISQARPRIALVTSALRSTLDTVLSPYTQVIELDPRSWREEEAPPQVSLTSTHLAYVVFTSGSTGTPKGVMIEHLGLVNHLQAMIRALGLRSEDKIAQTAPQSADISVWQNLVTLLVGGSVVVVSNEEVRDPRMLLQRIIDEEVTILQLIPSMISLLLDELVSQGVQPQALRRLRWIIPTGEALPPDLCRRWLKLFPHIPLVNAYGPAECSDDVSLHVIRQPPPPNELSVPIGYPLDNLQLYILDEALNLVPPGVFGELYVGGVGVGRGYRHSPVRTAIA